MFSSVAAVGTTSQQSNPTELHPVVEEVVLHSSTGTTHNVAMPADVPANRLLIVITVTNSDEYPDTPAGWEVEVDSNQIDEMAMSIFIKEAVGTEGGTTVNFSTSSSDALVAQVFMIDKWDGDTAEVDGGTNMGSFSPPDENVPWGVYSSLWISALGGSMSGTYSASPAGFSDFIEVSTGTTINDAQLYTSRVLNQEEYMDPGDWIFSSPSGMWCGAVVAIKGGVAT